MIVWVRLHDMRASMIPAAVSYSTAFTADNLY